MTPNLEPSIEPEEPAAPTPRPDAPAGEVTAGETDTPGRDEEVAPLPPDRTALLVVGMIVCSALLAVIVGLGLRPKVTDIAYIDTGSDPTELPVEATTTTTVRTANATGGGSAGVPWGFTSTVPPATTTTTAATPVDTTAAGTGGPSTPRPPRPHVQFQPTSSLDAYPKAQGMIHLSCCPGGAPGEISFSNPRLVGNNPNAKVPLVFLVKRDLGEWLEVYVPARPNGRTAYIKRSEVDLRVNPYRIEIYLQEFRIMVFEGNNVKLDAKIGVARAATPTPVGIFYDTELVRPPNAGGPYGPYAFGLSGFSDVLYSFGGGPGQIGIHGTNQPWAIGSEVSHGCIRLLNKDITYLASFIPLGTPVIINDTYT